MMKNNATLLKQEQCGDAVRRVWELMPGVQFIFYTTGKKFVNFQFKDYETFLAKFDEVLLSGKYHDDWKRAMVMRYVKYARGFNSEEMQMPADDLFLLS